MMTEIEVLSLRPGVKFRIKLGRHESVYETVRVDVKSHVVVANIGSIPMDNVMRFGELVR